MPVMHIRNMLVHMAHRGVLMEVGVWLSWCVQVIVRVAVMLVVHMRVGVRHRLVNVLVLVMLGKV
jgi:hypothetical protein